MRILYAVVTIIVLAAVTFAGWAMNFHFTEKGNAAAASKIMDRVRSWRLNRTNGAEIQKVAEEYKEFSSVDGQCEESCKVMIDLAIWQDKVRGMNLRKIGIRPSVYRFYFYVEKGKFLDVHFEQITILPAGRGLWFSIRQTRSDDRREEGDTRRVWSRIPRIKSPPPGDQALQQQYTSDITDSEWEQIMQFNFECATRLSQCTKRRDYMPVAWKQYVDWAREHHWPIEE